VTRALLRRSRVVSWGFVIVLAVGLVLLSPSPSPFLLLLLLLLLLQVCDAAAVDDGRGGEEQCFRCCAMVLPTRSTRKDRADSSVRCHSSPNGTRSKGATPLPPILDSNCARKVSFCAVLNTMGRERLICRGCGAPRSDVRKEVMVMGLSASWVKESGVGNKDEARRDCNCESKSLRILRSDCVGCPIYG
jgi:hypothetical protein